MLCGASLKLTARYSNMAASQMDIARRLATFEFACHTKDAAFSEVGLLVAIYEDPAIDYYRMQGMVEPSAAPDEYPEDSLLGKFDRDKTVKSELYLPNVTKLELFCKKVALSGERILQIKKDVPINLQLQIPPEPQRRVTINSANIKPIMNYLSYMVATWQLPPPPANAAAAAPAVSTDEEEEEEEVGDVGTEFPSMLDDSALINGYPMAKYLTIPEASVINTGAPPHINRASSIIREGETRFSVVKRMSHYMHHNKYTDAEKELWLRPFRVRGHGEGGIIDWFALIPIYVGKPETPTSSPPPDSSIKYTFKRSVWLVYATLDGNYLSVVENVKANDEQWWERNVIRPSQFRMRDYAPCVPRGWTMPIQVHGIKRRRSHAYDYDSELLTDEAVKKHPLLTRYRINLAVAADVQDPAVYLPNQAPTNAYEVVI